MLAHIGAPTLSVGARGPAVAALERRLAELHYAVRDTAGVFDEDLETSVVAFQSTGATGNTPLGLWHVYSKVVGWSWVLWYPNYFLRGFAIHGHPDVPPYPASHGCVRIPMWLAPKLFTQIPLGTGIYIYL